jgi:HD-like signal output (HDOD) protein
MTQASSVSTTPASSEAALEAIVQAAVKEISHIATLPEVTLKIISLVEDPDSTAQDLNKVISSDPALGARILKVVNSAFYGLPGQIGSTNRAIVLLGLNAVKNIAIAASLAKLFRGGQISESFNARDLWTHSIAVAAGTRMLAAKVGLGLPDEAFLAGLIHDIGIIVEIQVRRLKFVEALEKKQKEPGLTLRQAEQAVLGANHEQFGSGLCKLWKFPSNFAYVAGFHHRPLELAPKLRTLTSLVHLADVLASKLGLGYTGSVETLEFNPEVLKELELSQPELDQVGNDMPTAMKEAMTMLMENA